MTPTGKESTGLKASFKARSYITFGLVLSTVCVAAFLYIRSNSASKREVRFTSSSVAEHKEEQRQEESTQSDSDAELQKTYAEAKAYFAATLPEYRKQSLEYIAKRRQIQEDHPLIAAAFEFGVNQRSEAHKKYKAVIDKWSSRTSEQQEQFKRLNPQNLQMLGPQTYLNALGSAEQVGNTTLGAITYELLAQTEQFDVAKSNAITAVKQYLHDEILAASISKIEKPDEFIEALRTISARLRPQIDRNLQAMAPDAEGRDYLEAITHANGVFGLMQVYRKSWTAELDAKSEQLQVMIAGLVNRIQSLPQYSKERVELEQQLTDANEEFQSAANNPR